MQNQRTKFLEVILRIPILRGFFAGPRSCYLRPQEENTQETPGRPAIPAPQLVFVETHGTWPKESKWTKWASPLNIKLREEFPNAKFFEFQWSGANSAKARITAADELARGLKD